MVHQFFRLAICILLASSVCAQQPVHDVYGINQGLASHTVYCATQDKDGFMWFGTDAGVSRFDGIEFRNFTIDDGLCDNEVLRINQDSLGRIWFLSLSGCLAYFQEGKIYSASNQPNLAIHIQSLGMSNMFEDSRGNLWFSGIGAEVVLYDNFTSSIVLSDTTAHFKNRGRTFVMEHDNNRIFFIRPGLVFEWQNGQSRASVEIEGIMTLQNCFAQNENGDMYSFGTEGLERFRNGHWEIFLSTEHFSDVDNAQSLCASNAQNFWISLFSGGVEHVEIKASGEVTTRLLFENDWVNFVLVDKDRNEWFCTRDHGVFCVTREKKNNLFYDLGEECKVTCIESTADGQVFFATSIGDIYSISNWGDGTPFKVFESETGTPIITLTIDDEFIHFVTFTGTYRFSRTTSLPDPSAFKYDVNPPKGIALSADRILYFATLRGMKFIDLKKPLGVVETIEAIPTSRTYSMCAASDGKLWFENHDELFFFDEEGLTEMVDFNEKASGRISCIRETPTGEIAVATRGSGIFFLDDGKVISSLSKQNGLASNECEALRIFENRQYVITSSGISAYTFENGKISSLYNFTKADGIPAAKIFDVYADEQNLLLGTHLGLYKIPALSGRTESMPPIIHILQISGERKSFDPFQRFDISHNHNLKLDYTAITFELPNEVQFEYMLDDKTEWTKTTNRSIEFNALSTGNHTFRLRASKYNSPWSAPVDIVFAVLPPYWATWWFRLLMAVMAIALTYTLIRFFTKRKYRRQLVALQQEQALLRERNRISTDLHDDLGAELSNIVILSRIAKSKLKLKGGDEEPINKIDQAANDIINKMSGIIWSLNPANDRLDNLVDFVRKYALDFLELHSLEGDVHLIGTPGKSEVKGMVRRNAFLIVKEALHNVHKHSGASRVVVNMNIVEHQMKIEIQDNGRGFDMEKINSSGLGLISMKKRARDVGGLIEFSSEVGNGTKVELRFTV